MALIESHYAPVQGIGSTTLKLALKLACNEELFKYRYTEKDEGYKKKHAETTKVPSLSRQTGVPWILVCLIIILWTLPLSATGVACEISQLRCLTAYKSSPTHVLSLNLDKSYSTKP